MQSNSVSSFASTAPSLTDVLPASMSSSSNAASMAQASAADYMAAGMLWPYSQLFSPPYFPNQAPPPPSAFTIPLYCPTKPHVLDSNVQFHNSNLLRSSENPTNSQMAVQLGHACLGESSVTANNDVAATNSINGMKKPLGHSKAIGRGGLRLGNHETDDMKKVQDEANSKLYEFTKLAIHGCDLAEKVAKNHKYRPCFKKIDSLCARLKQDISRPDGVLNNLNSQGMAWAVKDFIFVFTRIINAWLILKGYIYNHSEGMKKVQGAFSANFQEGFFQWQEVTQQLIENIIESFENLDESVQKSRTNGAVSGSSAAPNNLTNGGGGSGGGLSTGINAPNNNNPKNGNRISSVDLSNFLWDNKEVTMRSSKGEEKYSSPYSDMATGGTSSGSSSASSNVTGSTLSTPIYNEAERDEFETYYKTGLYQSMKRKSAQKLGGLKSSESPDDFGAIESVEMPYGKEKVEGICKPPPLPHPQYGGGAQQAMMMEQGSTGDVDEMDLIDKLNLENNMKKYEQETSENIQYLLCRIREIKESAYFFNSHFLKNYFPGFEKVIKNLKDIRTITMEAEQGKYKYMFAIVADLKMIIQSCKLYLNLNPQPHLMDVVTRFEAELEKVLAEKCFSKFNSGLHYTSGF